MSEWLCFAIMELYLTSFAIYAIPLHIVAGLIWLLGRKEGMKWSVVEYLMLYLTWGLMISLAVSVFGGLEQAAVEMDVSESFLAGLSVGAGVCGGLSFLPRFLFSNHKVNEIMVTSVSSLILSTIFVKFVLLVFLFMPSTGPAAI